MKKALMILLALILMLLPLAALGEEAEKRVYDYGDLFTDEEEARLEVQCAAFVRTYDMEYIILTSNAPREGDAVAMADDFYDQGGFGTGANKSGFLFFLDLSDNSYVLSTCGDAVDLYTYDRAAQFEDQIVTALVNAKRGYSTYANACGESIKIVSNLLSGSFRFDVITRTMKKKGEMALTVTEIIIVAVIAIAVGLIKSLTTLSSYELKKSTYHYDYASNSEVRLTNKKDDFIRTVHQHIRVPRNPPSGSHGSGGYSGGSRSAGVHISSGGVRHGGSHGHF